MRAGGEGETCARAASLRLQLLRHAKSSHDAAELPDFDRPLAPRGIRAARVMGQAIARVGMVPDHVLCSPARRAAETWRLVSLELPRVPETTVDGDIYDFGDGSRLLDVIRLKGGEAKSLMLVGHNPSMEELAKRLIGTGPPALRRELEAKFPTCAMAVIACRCGDWSELAENTGELTHFMRPRDVGQSL